MKNTVIRGVATTGGLRGRGGGGVGRFRSGPFLYRKCEHEI